MTDHNNLTDDECKKVLTNLIKRFEILYSNNSNHENIIEELADLMSCGLIGDISENKLQNSFEILVKYGRENIAGRNYMYEILKRANEIYNEEIK